MPSIATTGYKQVTTTKWWKEITSKKVTNNNTLPMTLVDYSYFQVYKRSDMFPMLLFESSLLYTNLSISLVTRNVNSWKWIEFHRPGQRNKKVNNFNWNRKKTRVKTNIHVLVFSLHHFCLLLFFYLFVLKSSNIEWQSDICIFNLLFSNRIFSS